jgi:hypothetical protein
MVREIGVRGNYTYKAGIWQEDAHRGLLWSTTGTAKRTSQYIAPTWSWASLIDQARDLGRKVHEVIERVVKIVYIDVTNVGDDIYGQVSSASLKIQSRWRSIDPWDQEQAEFPTPNTFPELFQNSLPNPNSEKIEVYFDLEKTQGSPAKNIICIQIAKAKRFGRIDWAPPTFYALLLEPTNHSKPNNKYQRIGLAALPTLAR